MVDISHNRVWLRLGLSCLGSLLVLAGCGPKNYKRDADERVYRIIDQKWEPEFGTKANYRISDVPPGPNDIQIANAVPASGLLTLPYALALATAHSREYQTQKDRLYKAALDLRLVEHGYETQLFGGGSVLYINDRNNLRRKRPATEIIQTEANVGFNRVLATGTQIGTRVATGWADVLAGRGISGWNSIFSAVVAQPLLRGSDPMIVLEGLTQAERDTLYQIRAFNRFRKTFAVAVATQYFRALELYDITQNTRAYHDALVALESQVVKLASAGLVQKLEVDQVQQDVLRARDMLIVAQKKYEQALDQFKLTLALPMAAEFRIDTGLVDTLKQRGLPYPEFAIDEAVETALCRRLDMANRADAVLDAQRVVYVAADSLRADLRLTGKIDIDTHGDRKIAAGPILDLPLDRVPEQHDYRIALIGLEERRRQYDELADTVRLEVRDAHRKLVETAERYKASSEGLEKAQTRIKRASVLMRYGQASSRRVLDPLHDLYDARNAATNALVEYAIATLNFYRDTEALQVRPDGMWEQGPELPVSSVKTTANASTTAR
jgi:outer membrane protein TolC